VPNLLAYDPAFAYELAVIIQDGIRRMFELGEDIFYYLTLGNEPYPMPPMPEGAAAGILRGMYKLRPAANRGERGASTPRSKVHLLGSGAILREVLRAQELLAERFGVAADVWSVTSYKELRRDALEAERWSLLHPEAQAHRSYVERLLAEEKGVFVAATDFMKSVPEMIDRWVPGDVYALGTDGFGRSDTRAALRRFFEVDAECIALAALHQLARRGEMKAARVQKAIQELGIDPEKVDPMRA
jgi:pyruvate dehydrogenase E1 component